jgi:formylglycine-generating enzyme required for sulfatase activity
MAAIPGGSYALAARGDQAAVPPFCLDLTEVTIGAYKKCVDSGACTPPNAHGSTAPNRACNWNSPGRENHPVNCVDWSQASAYCASSGNRLPTEEEWEWAARSGNAGSTYPWGEAEPNETLVNACGGECQRSSGQKAMYPGDDGFPGTAPVGSFPKGDSSSGVHDLAGNVWEWTQSLFNATDRVCRGGSWGDGAGSTSLKAQTRGWFSPSDRDPVLGFRCAK